MNKNLKHVKKDPHQSLSEPALGHPAPNSLAHDKSGEHINLALHGGAHAEAGTHSTVLGAPITDIGNVTVTTASSA